MYSSDGTSIQVSVCSKGGKTQVLYAKPSSAASMETHWEEVIQCMQPEAKSERSKKFNETSIDGEDTESELIVIPESDLSDSTLHGSVQDSFEEALDESCSFSTKNEKVNAIVKIHESLDTATKMTKDVFISQIIRTPTTKRPTWIIGSEEESIKSWENKNYSLHDTSLKTVNDISKNCTKFTSIDTNSLSNTVAVVTGIPNVQMNNKNNITENHKNLKEINRKTVNEVNRINLSEGNKYVEMNDSSSVHSLESINNKMSSIGKHKKIIEPCLTPVCTPVSDCDDCYKNQNQIILSAPSVERLLPIGSSRSPVLKTAPHNFCEENLQSPDSPLSKMDLMVLDSPPANATSPLNANNKIDSQLEIPTQERLLPIGSNSKDVCQLVDKIKQALGLNAQPPKLLENKKPEGFENKIGTPSPRRLIKQVALESPPNPGDLEDGTVACRNANADNKSKYFFLFLFNCFSG